MLTEAAYYPGMRCHDVAKLINPKRSPSHRNFSSSKQASQRVKRKTMTVAAAQRGVASLSAANDRRLASNSTADLVRILIGSRLALTTNFRRLWIWFDSYYRRALTRDHLPAFVASHRRRLDKPTRCRPTTDGTHGGRNYLTHRGPTFGACYCTRPGKNASNCRRKHPSCVVED